MPALLHFEWNCVQLMGAAGSKSSDAGLFWNPTVKIRQPQVPQGGQVAKVLNASVTGRLLPAFFARCL